MVFNGRTINSPSLENGACGSVCERGREGGLGVSARCHFALSLSSGKVGCGERGARLKL